MSIDFATDLKWVRSHVILLLITAALVFGAVYYIVSLQSRIAAAEGSKYQTVLSSQQATTSALQSQLQQDEARWSEINSQLLASNQKLSAAVVSRDSTLAATISRDKTLSAGDTAKKLGGTANGDNIILPLPTGRDIAVSLDTLAATQHDLADTRSQLVNETQVAENLQANLTEEDKLLSAFRTTSADQDKACKAQVADLKAAARKSKLKWFLGGWVAGIISARMIGI